MSNLQELGVQNCNDVLESDGRKNYTIILKEEKRDKNKLYVLPYTKPDADISEL